MKKTILFLAVLLLVVFSASAQIMIRYRTGEPHTQSPLIRFHLNIVNTGAAGIALKDVTVRYFHTKEGDAREGYQVEYAVMGTANIRVTFENVYAEVSFPGSTLTIPPGGETGEIHLRFMKQDWTNYNQANDPSFSHIPDFVDYDRIAGYLNGVRVWGREMFPVPSPVVSSRQ